MMVDGVKLRLAQWGRWAQGGLPSLPTASPLWCTEGRGSVANVTMPPDIAEVDHLVCVSPLLERCVLISFYTQHGNIRHKRHILGMGRREYLGHLERGESFVAFRL